MAGDAWVGKLDTYLDGELPAQEMRDLDAHLRTCPACSAEVLNRVQLKRAVQSAGKRYVPSAEFRQRMQKSMASRSTTGFRWSWVPALALLVLLAAGSVVVHQGRQRLQREQVYSELADLHVATLASSTQVDVVSSDRHTVKPWFQGKIPFTFNLPELRDSGFVLLGGRVTYLGRAPGAHLLYQIRKHEISVFIFDDRQLDRRLSPDSGVRKRQSFNVETWSADGLRYFVVGDASSDDIYNLSMLLKTAAKS